MEYSDLDPRHNTHDEPDKWSIRSVGDASCSISIDATVSFTDAYQTGTRQSTIPPTAPSAI